MLYKEAIFNKLQIIFTTHSPTIFELADLVNIRYIFPTSEKTLCINQPNSDIYFNLTGERKADFEIYVEDDTAKAIIKHIAYSLGVSERVEVIKYGAAINLFTVLAGKILTESCSDNDLFILDGDEYSTLEEKEKRIAKVLTGTENYADSLRTNALSKIRQFNLPQECNPEKRIWELVCQVDNGLLNTGEIEIKNIVSRNSIVLDNHDYLDKPIEQMKCSKDVGIEKILQVASKNEDGWFSFISDIYLWLDSKHVGLV